MISSDISEMQRAFVICSKSVRFIESGAHCPTATGKDRVVGTLRNQRDRILVYALLKSCCM